jgi:DNA-binding NarL/FixJ family response regulator
MADDHTLVLEGFRRMLEPAFDLLGVAEDGQQVIEMAVRLRPDIVLMDISMPVLNGFEAARRIRKEAPGIRIIFLTMHGDNAYVEEAARLGASYVLKRSGVAELGEAIRQAMQGKRYVTPSVSSWYSSQPPAMGAKRPEPDDRLSPREREVLQLIAEGRAGKEMAYMLNISLKTVEFHKRSIMTKLGLRSTAELTRYAVRHGLVDS